MKLESFYNQLLSYPKTLLSIVVFLVLLIGSYASELEVDASAETLLLKNDKSLEFTREINKRYASQEYLVVTFTPKNSLLSDETLAQLQSISDELVKIAEIDSVISILNVPLLQYPSESIKELLNNIPTLSGDINRSYAKDEFLTSALYKENLVSSDFKTTALLLNLKKDEKYSKLLNERNKLLVGGESKELKDAESRFKIYRDTLREKNHETIVEVRDVLHNSKGDSEIFLGGINMITDDMVSFVKSDLKVYGGIVILLIIFIVWFLFGEFRFVFISIGILILSVLAMTGILGFLSLEVTVVSSNFVALQMILTMSLVIHLSVRYRELIKELPDASHKEIIAKASSSMFVPSFYVIITTMVGFSSLVASGIIPVMNLGWMMSLGVFISLIVTYLVFPTFMILFEKKSLHGSFDGKFSITKHIATWVESYPKTIFASTLFLVLFSASGATQLIVENSFIDYFKKDTEIYKGMYVIDKQLGGTTPLDVIIDLPDTKKEVVAPKEEVVEDEFDEFNDFEEELAEVADENQYWFTSGKMKKIEAIHDYLDSLKETGKVLSFATTLKVGHGLNSGEDLDNLELALIYNELPQKYKNILINPYLSIENNQLRFSIRVIDSMKDLRRDELLKRIQKDIHEKFDIAPQNIRLSNMMVLYNNMLQSLFSSQIKTLGIVIVILFLMFLMLFKSLKVALVASLVNIIPVAVIFGFMGYYSIPLDMMTITIAAISLGIAVDNTIHYLYRFEVEYAKDGDYLASMYRAHGTIGSAMYYTSVVIMVGFSVLTLSSFYPTIYFGMLTMLAMFMALVADLLLLPRLILWVKPFKE